MQVHVLSLRFLRSWYRCPVNLAIQGAQYIFFALLIGEAHPTVSGCGRLHVRASLYSARLGRQAQPHALSAARPGADPCLKVRGRLGVQWLSLGHCWDLAGLAARRVHLRVPGQNGIREPQGHA